MSRLMDEPRSLGEWQRRAGESLERSRSRRQPLVTPMWVAMLVGIAFVMIVSCSAFAILLAAGLIHW